MCDARSLLLKAYDTIQDKQCYGSCTACVITLDRKDDTLTAANVGDSGYLLFRQGKIVHKSEPERITYECPRQLDSYPWKEESRKMGVSYTDIM
jgi:protein phosphatase PTC7